MEPKTREQKKVIAMSRRIRPASETEKRWLLKAYRPDVIIGPKQWWCTECGYHDKNVEEVREKAGPKKKRTGWYWQSSWNDDNGKFITCPNCGARLSLEHVRCTFDDYFNNEIKDRCIVTTFEGYQVVRWYEVGRSGKWKAGSKLSMCEIAQHWISPEGKVTFVSRQISGMMYSRYYHWGTGMEVRKASKDAWKADMRIQRIIPTLRRNGFQGDFYGLPPVKVMRTLLSSNYAETLLKCGQMSAFRQYVSEGGIKYDKQLMICLRHGYIIDDYSMWCDYVSLLNVFGKDIRNPHYLCPLDLVKEHDRLVEKKRKKDEADRLKREAAEALKREEDYAMNKKMFIGLMFGNGNIMVHVIGSVSEMLEEGTRMHHCVFGAGYYKRPESLILSARDMNDNRVETVEVSLKSYRVVQSRGVNNSRTNLHDEIVALVNSNMSKIRKADMEQKKWMREHAEETRLVV